MRYSGPFTITRPSLVAAIEAGIEAARGYRHQFGAGRPISDDEAATLREFAATAPATTVGDYYPCDAEVSPGCPWSGSGLDWWTNDSPDIAFAKAFDTEARKALIEDGTFDVLVVD